VSAGWPGMTGPTNRVRVGTRSAGEGTCPDYLAAKAHPALWPAAPSRARKEKLDTFPLGILNAALDEIERNGATIAQAIDLAVEKAAREGKRPHPAALTWVRDGAEQYIAGAARHQGQFRPEYRAAVLVQDYWVAREDRRTSGGRLWEMYAYGRRYESSDGSVREIRLLHYGTFDPRQPDEERQEAPGREARRARGPGGHRRLQCGVRRRGALAPALVGAVPALSGVGPACHAGHHSASSPGGTRRRRAPRCLRGNAG
jgi:hypothetical protein